MMRSSIRLLWTVAAMTAAALVAGAAPAQASTGEGEDRNAVFVQTNDPHGNAIAAYHREADGTLTLSAIYRTGGLGGRTAGSASDPLASQGSLVLVRSQALLLAVNAGSDTISVFRVAGDNLRLDQVIESGGEFPTGFAVHGNLVYVLDAGGKGHVSGFRIRGGRLHAIEDSTRSLRLGNTTPPFFLTAPAQVGFTPDGRHLIVTTKTNNTVDVFSVGAEGQLSAQPVSNAEAGVPFAFVFDGAGRMVLNFAGTSSLETFTVNANNTLTPVSAPATDGQVALCWVASAHGFEYAANTGSNNVSEFKIGSNGSVSLINATAASNIPGAIDIASADGRFLYVESGASSSVYAFQIGAGGALTAIQVAHVPDGGDLEGIAAT